MDPLNVNDPEWWKSLGAIFGPGGIALLISLAASLYFNRMLWARLKEKDEECQTEKDKAEARWEARFQSLRADIKEAFGVTADLTVQVTRLVERAGAMRTP